LAFFIVHFVYRPNWQQTVDTFTSQVVTPHPKMAVMIDVESWGGQIRGNQSAARQFAAACGVAPVLPVELAARQRRLQLPARPDAAVRRLDRRLPLAQS
jgi:hypothetical protein